MPIYMDGQEYQDGVHFEMATNPFIPQELRTEFKQALEATEKPADALKTKSGTPLPDTKIDAVRAPYGVMADVEIPEGSAQGAVLRERIDSTAKSMFEAFTLPGKVYLGEVDPSTPEARGRAFELGSAMVFGPSTFAGRVADGTLGSFAGVKSKTFDKNNLALAQIMESDGKHVDAIFAKTGMFRGVDGRWRYEISDTAATINQEALKYHPEIPPMQKVENIFEQRPFTEADYFAGSSTAKLSDFYNHPELYKAYPQLKKIDVVEDLNYKGIAEANSDGFIRYNPEGVKASGWTLKEILTHEIQHLIQNIEGFAKGGAPMKILNEGNDPYRLAFQINPDALSKVRKTIQEFVNKGRQGQLSDAELDQLVYFNKVLETHEKYISEANKQAMETYIRLAGETEARNVSARSSMDPAMAKTLHPEWTQDVASQNQIVTQDPVFTTAYGTLRHTNDEYTKVPPAQSADVKLPDGYYDKIPQERRLSRSSTEPSHPGYRWEVFDPQTGKVMRKDIMTRVGASTTMHNLDNKYGGYRYRVRMVKANKRTENEEKFLLDNGIEIE